MIHVLHGSVEYLVFAGDVALQIGHRPNERVGEPGPLQVKGVPGRIRFIFDEEDRGLGPGCLTADFMSQEPGAGGILEPGLVPVQVS